MTIKTVLWNLGQFEPYCIVDYEQHGNPILAVILEKKKNKWLVLSQFGAELEMTEDRLFLLPEKVVYEKQTRAELEKFLVEIKDRAENLQNELSLEDAWNIFYNNKSEVSAKDIVELLAINNNLVNFIAVRRLLLADKVYFKRLKNTFEPRSEETVRELKHQVKIEEERKRQQEILFKALLERFKGNKNQEIPDTVTLLEDYAALGRSLANYKEADLLIDSLIDKAKLKINKSSPDKAFQVLLQAEHFSADQNLNLIRAGRRRDFKASSLQDVAKILELQIDKSKIQDFKKNFILTIDSEETRDFDDAFGVCKTANGYRLEIHISDVSTFLKNPSKLFDEAFYRSSSIYCPDETIPMLPRELSENKFSLIQDEERIVLSFIIDLDLEFNIIKREILHSEVVVKKRLSYQEVDQILASNQKNELSELLQDLGKIALKLEEKRIKNGAVQLPRLEKVAKLDSSKKISIHIDNEDTLSHKIVAEMMILANESAALFGKENELALIYRSQDKPEVNIDQHVEQIPMGPAREYAKRGLLKRSKTLAKAGIHAGLGLEAYLQVTSPIRRFMDLINQQQLLSYIYNKKQFYSQNEVEELIKDLEGSLDEVGFLQRERNKYFLLRYLQQEKIKMLQGVVVKVDGPKPLVFIGLLGMIAPFYPDNIKDKDSLKKKYAQEITLNIELIDPRNEKFILREKLNG